MNMLPYIFQLTTSNRMAWPDVVFRVGWGNRVCVVGIRSGIAYRTQKPLFCGFAVRKQINEPQYAQPANLWSCFFAWRSYCIKYAVSVGAWNDAIALDKQSVRCHTLMEKSRVRSDRVGEQPSFVNRPRVKIVLGHLFAWKVKFRTILFSHTENMSSSLSRRSRLSRPPRQLRFDSSQVHQQPYLGGTISRV